ncbi:MAG TPA: hypothetical protein EYP19_11900, partial [Desulfobacterales bacterium]|nr:hypothetical protein [Desulfobacterales bacterium]
MVRSIEILITGLLMLVPVFAAAKPEKPDMTRQDTWGEAEKEAFYRWLKQQTAPEEETQLVNTPTFEQMQRIPGGLSSKYLSLRTGTYGLFGFTPKAQENEGTEKPGEIDGSLWGLDLQYGKPVRTWFRQILNLGFYKGSVDQKAGGAKLSGDFSLYRFGYHLEVALVPLGLDQTRNILLRGGLDMLYGRKGDLLYAAKGDTVGQRRRDRQKAMLGHVTGFQAGLSWALGYEWQLGENFWRVHGMFDGFKVVHVPKDKDRENYAVLGVFVGVS